MRVRSKKKTSEARPLRRGKLRRDHAPEHPAQAPEAPADGPPNSFRRDLADERRLRESGGPRDRATYTCQCGYLFEADVSTSVACPNCGCSQAW